MVDDALLCSLKAEGIWSIFCCISATVLPFDNEFVLQDLKDIMRTAGEVTFADAHKQHPNEG